MDLRVKIGKCILDNPIMNASGPRCTNKDELCELLFSDSSAIVSKSCTIEKRNGNDKPRYFHNDYLSINSMGLPNNGYNFYIDMISKINDSNTKPYIISIAGLNLNDNITIINKIHKKLNKNPLCNVGIEINLSCPNIINKGQLAYDFKNMDLYLEELFRKIKIKHLKMIGIKLPPYFELHHFKIVSDIILKYPIDFITTINSIGNGLVIDPEKESPVIRPKQGLGGLGGSIVKPTGLSNVFNFAKHLIHTNVKIIGVGGIETGTDVFEYILAGASAVQIGTYYYKEGTPCFKYLKERLLTVMDNKKYKTIKEFHGKLVYNDVFIE
jgi:dihydroorotate dehydrogenase (fumarate)